MTKPRITVIMNSFREKPEWLSAAIRSYLSQQDVDVQLILSMVTGDKNLTLPDVLYADKVVESDNPGIYEQINAAIPFIEGEYVCYASSNDFAAPFKLRSEYDCCINSGKAVCYSSFYKCDVSLRVINTYNAPVYDYTAHLDGNFVNDCALVRSDIFRKYTPFQTEWGNSAYHDLWLRIYEGEGDVFVANKKPTWYYRFHEGMKNKRMKSQDKIRRNRETRERMLLWHKDTFRLIMQDVEDMVCPENIQHIKNATNVLDKIIVEHNKGINEGITHFVYVYVASPTRWNELAVSVQSIRKHFQGSYKIFCVGDAPGIKDVIHIPVPQIKGRGSKAKDAVMKLMAICECGMINPDFVYCYDDVILLRPITREWFDKRIAIEYVPDYAQHWKGARGIIPDQGWRALFLKTFALLTKKQLPTFNYETHLPRMMNKAQIKLTLDKFGREACEDALFSSLHYNLHYEKPDLLLKENNRIKAGLHRAYSNPEKIIGEIKGRTWLNYSDPAVNELFKKTITKIMKGEIKI